MDPSISSRFRPEVLDKARERYSIAADFIRLLDGFESFMYEFDRPDGRFILRLSHSLRHSQDQICGEVDWINYLYAGGVNVARALLSERGNLVEPVDDGQGGEFLCTAFTWASGEHMGRRHLCDQMFANYGRLLGKMHALAKTYTVPNPSWKRPEWDTPENIPVDKWFPAELSPAFGKYTPLAAHLAALPRDADSYGMIHQDAHPGNFFVDDKFNITLFDFDDCVYGHFIYDLAMVLFYTSPWDKDPAAFTARFMPVFLGGYREENRLDPVWLKELPNYMKLREIDLFAQIHSQIPDWENSQDPWTGNYMRGRREKILADTPFITYDWESLSPYL